MGYLDAGGDFVIADALDIEKPAPAPELVQSVGEHKFEVFNAVADTTLTAASIISQAVLDGVQVFLPDGSASPLAVTGFIARIVISLKPVTGGVGALGETAQSTTSEAIVTAGGQTLNMDPGGSQTFGAIETGGFLVPTSFTDLRVLAGSSVLVTVVFATAPVVA